MIRSNALSGQCLSDEARPYWIASHVHVRHTPEGCVLLDLRRDKYLGLGRQEAAMLASAVNGWPEPLSVWGPGADARNAEEACGELCASLLKDGLICGRPPDVVLDRRAQQCSLKLEWVAIGDELEVPCKLGVRDIARFCAAFVSAWWSLKYGRLERTVARVNRSREGADGDQPADIFRLARSVDAFRQMRTFVFAAEGRCLLHALALTSFLSRYGLSTEWVIGVRTQPWGAHSWVQWQRFLLDTTPEKIGQYLPILVV